jgi:hypothetical protein
VQNGKCFTRQKKPDELTLRPFASTPIQAMSQALSATPERTLASPQRSVHSPAPSPDRSQHHPTRSVAPAAKIAPRQTATPNRPHLPPKPWQRTGKGAAKEITKADLQKEVGITGSTAWMDLDVWVPSTFFADLDGQT